MTADFVLDASALAKTFVREAESDAFFAWLEASVAKGSRLHAPSLIRYELTEVVRKNRSAIDYPGDDPARALVRDATQALVLDDDAWSRIDPWLDRLSAYGACYVAMAIAKAATLVTYDARMVSAASGHVDVLSPGAEAGHRKRA